MHHANKNKTNYLFRFCNVQKVNEACNGSLIIREVQENGMKPVLGFAVQEASTMTAIRGLYSDF